jgi:alpha-tubulin suppressor-like RCC1 family protein
MLLCRVGELETADHNSAWLHTAQADTAKAAACFASPRRGVIAVALALATAVATTCLCFTASAAAHVPYQLSAWGGNWVGQLGLGNHFGPEECSVEELPCSTTAVPVSGIREVVAVAAGENHSLAIAPSGSSSSSVWAWGENLYDQLGDGNSWKAQPETNAPVAACQPYACAGQLTASSVAAGGRHSLALSGSAVLAWGDNESGQLGTGFNGRAYDREAPAIVKYGPERGYAQVEATQVAAGEEHSLALVEDGHVMAWGNNEFGQVGDGKSELTKDGPTPVVFERNPLREVTGVTKITAGANHSVALLSDHSVIAWGSNDHGQLGDYTNSGPQICEEGPCSKVAVYVAGPRKANPVEVAAGGDHSLARLEDGTVVAWGANGSGQLGDGTTTDKYEMVAVKGLSHVVEIAAGEEHSLALLENGTVMAWGANGEGQLGDGTSLGPERCGTPPEEQACSTTPVAVSGLGAISVKGIAAGAQHDFAFGPPFPTVTSINPREGLTQGGTAVTIGGSEFNGATAVRFGDANATAFHVESSTSITAIAPAGSGAVDVTVTTPEGTSKPNPADQFSYVNPLVARPSVSGVSPAQGPAAGGTSVTISGTNLAGATAVRFGSASASAYTVNSEGTSITAVDPSGEGSVDVTVTTPGGTSATNPGDSFRYEAWSPPSVTAVDPNEGPQTGGTSVTITGAYLLRATAVKFGGVTAQFVVNSDTTITAVAPSNICLVACLTSPHTVDVMVTTPAGTSAKVPADQFTYAFTPPPSASGGSASPARSTPRIVGLNVHPGELDGELSGAAPLTEHWKAILGGAVHPVQSLRIVGSRSLQEAGPLAIAGTKFQDMTCIVGNGQFPAELIWREGPKELHPSLKAALEGNVGEGNLAHGIAKWEEETLKEVEKCDPPHAAGTLPAVAVIEIMNEPWNLEGRGPAGKEVPEEGTFAQNAELYGQICLGLLRKVTHLQEEGKLALIPLIASADKWTGPKIGRANRGMYWLTHVLAGGGQELGKLLGGLSFHPYAKKAVEGAESVKNMVEQRSYAAEEPEPTQHPGVKRMANPVMYATEYGYKASGRHARKQQVETETMFHLLKEPSFSWVEGIWYYDFIDDNYYGSAGDSFANGHPLSGWYSSPPPPSGEGARPVKTVVEECAAEEAESGKTQHKNC